MIKFGRNVGAFIPTRIGSSDGSGIQRNKPIRRAVVKSYAPYFSFCPGRNFVKPEAPPPLALEHGTSAH
jgi:hypothetical protein